MWMKSIIKRHVNNIVLLMDKENFIFEALALAQLVKRLNWAEIRACAVNDEEAYQIKDTLGKL